MDASGLGWGPVVGCCVHGDERSSSIKGGEFLDQLSDCQLLKKDCAQWSQLNLHLLGICGFPSIR
jgi:hypothetical protein